MSGMILTIPIAPRTKKNHMQIMRNKKTGRVFAMPSKQYLEYEKQAGKYIDDADRIRAIALSYPVNVKMTFYVDSLRKCDLVNLEQAILDILVKYKILQDDDWSVVRSMDGSRVNISDTEHPRTVIEITEIEGPTAKRRRKKLEE